MRAASLAFDPMQSETIVVQGRGMERWIAMRLADRLGVWANASFPFPRRLFDTLFAASLGDSPEEAAYFEPETLRWAIARELLQLRGDAPFAPIDRFLGGAHEAQDASAGDHGHVRLLQLSRRLASLFDHYTIYRPESVLAWDDGANPTDWQACLWRAISAERRRSHLAARARRFVTAFDNDDLPTDGLPPRVLLFGLSTLPPLFLEVLVALSRHIEVHLFLLSPSREYWADLRTQREQLRALRQHRLRAARRGVVQLELDFEHVAGALHHEEGHPLLASLGRQGRDFQRTLEEAVDYVDDPRELYAEPGEDTALHVLQSDLLHLRSPGTSSEGDSRRIADLSADDDSIRVHSCYGAMREVEVLRDLLRDRFERDPSLRPEDVIVMTPDIDHYAPLIQTVFGEPEAPDVQPMPFRIADRGVRATRPWLEAFFQLLSVLQGRLSSIDVFDLIRLEPIREHFGIADDELSTVQSWVLAAGVRAEVDAAHREELGQPASAENTWRFGLDRLVLGYAMLPERPPREDPSASAGPSDEQGLYCGVLPLAGIEGTSAELLGRVVELCEQLFAFRVRLRTTVTVSAWRETLLDLARSLLRQVDDDAYERGLLSDCLATVVSRAQSSGFDAEVGLRAIVAELDEVLELRASNATFLSGGVTFCRMVPMRSIPFRVVALIGMSDDAFPRRGTELSFDLRRHDALPGDRSARDDDRYLFLEALLSARDALIVTYVGQSGADGKSRPPSVVVGELLDALVQTYARGDDDAPEARAQTLRRHFVVEHPLQAFHRSYFETHAGSDDAPARPKLFSYNAGACEAARSLESEAVVPPPFVAVGWALEGEPPERIALDDLVAQLTRPVMRFVEHELDVSFDEVQEPVDTSPPFVENPLDRHALATSMLELVVRRGLPAELVHAGEEALHDALRAELSAHYDAMRAAGRLPWGPRGRATYESLAAEVVPLAARVLSLRAGEPAAPALIDLVARGRLRLTGELASLHTGGRVLHSFSRATRSFHRRELGAWVEHVVLQVAARSRHETFVVGRLERGAPRVVAFAPLEEATARRYLDDFIELYLEARRHPLAFEVEASKTYLEALRDPKTAQRALVLAAEVLDEGGDPYLGRVFPDARELVHGAEFDRVAHAIVAPWLDHREVRT